jgi:hypothetical protein
MVTKLGFGEPCPKKKKTHNFTKIANIDEIGVSVSHHRQITTHVFLVPWRKKNTKKNLNVSGKRKISARNL